MKLRAGLCLLKLANAKVYDKAMSWELFESVASVCQVDLDHRAPSSALSFQTFAGLYS